MDKNDVNINEFRNKNRGSVATFDESISLKKVKVFNEGLWFSIARSATYLNFYCCNLDGYLRKIFKNWALKYINY